MLRIGDTVKDRGGKLYKLTDRAYQKVGTNNFKWHFLCLRLTDGKESWIEESVVGETCKKVKA